MRLAKKNYTTLISILLLLILAIIGFQSGIFSSSDKMQLYLEKAGIWAPILFLVIQIVQVVVPIIPGGVSCAISVIVFGPVYGFLYNYIGIVIGSTINFLLAKQYGKPFILKIVSIDTYEKYVSWTEKGMKFDILFTLAILFPGAPDDLLCLIAGLTPMSLKKFILILLLTKPFSLAIYSIGLTVILNWITTIL